MLLSTVLLAPFLALAQPAAAPVAPAAAPTGAQVGVRRTAIPMADSSDGSLGGARPRNAIVILLDDWGMDMMAIYGTPDLSGACITRPPTPNIDALAQSGVTFLNAWVEPVCSPTRASLLTGRQPFRHKIGRVVDQCGCPTTDALDPQEFTIPEMLREAALVGLLPPYGTAAVGKWHLGEDPMSPLIQGFDTFRGSQHNIRRADYPNETYCSWLKNTDGNFSMSQTYSTTDTVDEALSFIAGQAGDPYFLYMAMQAPHAPYHIPPAHLAPSYFLDDGQGGCFHAQQPSCPVQPAQCLPISCPAPVCQESCDLPLNAPLLDQVAAKRPYYEAMVEATDTEIGRLLTGVDLTTTIIFLMGDNGSPGGVTSRPFLGDRTIGLPPKSKGSIYQGGVNVPFIVAGAGVRSALPGRPQRTEAQMIHIVDLYATIADLFGIDALTLLAISPNVLDSQSFKHLLTKQPGRNRKTLFSEVFSPNFPTSQAPCALQFARTLRNQRYKLLRYSNPLNCSGPAVEEFYDLFTDPFEGIDLMLSGAHLVPGPVRSQYLALSAELDSIPLP
ncbi:Arylsulfatase [Planctomycetes bacterium Poly30]|uniref:Arylsulfatase n=1 Tax=Saltatorellus ferox TaxID=2528018 RepID=A0A518EL11_9BACT|nr:Arylsulfatase [Planctomycetes bacterium Poly30]